MLHLVIMTHTTLGGTPLDECSARRRDLYLTTHTIHNRNISRLRAAFEPTIPASEGPLTHALERAASVTGITYKYSHDELHVLRSHCS